MLKKCYRMQKNALFKHVFANGKSYVSKHVVIYVLKAYPAKFGFIASKRIGSAVTRNRARRLLREAIRLNLKKIKLESQVILIARKPLVNASFKEVEKSVLYLCRKAGILNENS